MGWIERYVEAARCVSPLTPESFHRAIGLWVVSAVVGRRVVVKLPWGEFSPTLWVVLLAPSTTFRKTTAMSIGRELLRRVKPNIFAAHQATPEALWNEFQANPHRALVADEFSLLLAASGRDYMAGSVEFLMQLADEPPFLRRHTKGEGDVTVQRPSLAILGASTPALLKKYVADERLWANGWWARFAFAVAPDDAPPWVEAKDADGELSALADELVALDARLNTDAPLTAAVAQDAFALWSQFNKAMTYDALKDPTLSDGDRAAFGRAPMHAMRVALALATLDWASTDRVPTVGVEHVKQATRIASDWLKDARRAITAANRSVVEETADRIAKMLEAVGGELTRREIQQRIRTKPEVLDGAIAHLKDVGLVVVESESGRGGVTQRIRLAA